MATLYHVPTSRSLRVLWTLEEIGATVEVKSLGWPPPPEYLAINPAGTLPALIGPRATAYRERLLARSAFQRAAAVP